MTGAHLRGGVEGAEVLELAVVDDRHLVAAADELRTARGREATRPQMCARHGTGGAARKHADTEVRPGPGSVARNGQMTRNITSQTSPKSFGGFVFGFSLKKSTHLKLVRDEDGGLAAEEALDAVVEHVLRRVVVHRAACGVRTVGARAAAQHAHAHPGNTASTTQ